MKKVLIFFIALYLFSLTPIYKKYSPAYFKKIHDFIDMLMSPEKSSSSPKVNFLAPTYLPSQPATRGAYQEPVTNNNQNDSQKSKNNFSNYGYHKNY